MNTLTRIPSSGASVPSAGMCDGVGTKAGFRTVSFVSYYTKSSAARTGNLGTLAPTLDAHGTYPRCPWLRQLYPSRRAGPRIMSFHSKLFHYNVDEIWRELNSHLCQLVYGRIGFVVSCFASIHRTYRHCDVRTDCSNSGLSLSISHSGPYSCPLCGEDSMLAADFRD